MKILKRLFCLTAVTSTVLLPTVSTHTNAQTVFLDADTEVQQLVPNAPTNSSNDEFTIQGGSAPSNGTAINLSTQMYSYDVTDMGYRVYTNNWLTGASTVKVVVDNWNPYQTFGGTFNQLTVQVRDNSTIYSTQTVTINKPSGTAITLSGLPKDKKYYICFETPLNGNRYSFNGTILKLQ